MKELKMQRLYSAQRAACFDQCLRLAWVAHLLVWLLLLPTLACAQSAPGSIQAKAYRRQLTQESMDLSFNTQTMKAISDWAEGQKVYFDGWGQGDPCGNSGTCCSSPFNTTDSQFEDVCPWSRICCSGGAVTRMDLSCYECDTQLEHPLPVGLFSKLVSLQELLISNHRLPRGLIGMNWSALSDMRLLDLSSNRLSEPLPNDGAFPAQLETLKLNGNLLYGGLPAGWASPDKPLQEVNLANNRLTGGIPASWAQFDNLQKLDVRDNCGMCGLTPNLGSILVLRSGTALGFQCTNRQCGGRNYMPLIVSFSIALGLAILIGLLYIYRYRVSQAHPVFAVLVRNILPPPRPRMVDLQWEAAVRAARNIASSKPPKVMLLRLTVNVDTGTACLERVRSHASSSPPTRCQATPVIGTSPDALSPSGSLGRDRIIRDASTDQEGHQSAALTTAATHNVSDNTILTITDVSTHATQCVLLPPGQGHIPQHVSGALPATSYTTPADAAAIIPVGNSRLDNNSQGGVQPQPHPGDSNAANVMVVPGTSPVSVNQEPYRQTYSHHTSSRRHRRHRSRHAHRPVDGDSDHPLDAHSQARTTDKPLYKFRLPGVDALIIAPDMESICFAQKVTDDAQQHESEQQQAASVAVQGAVQAAAQAAAAAVEAARIAVVRAMSIESPPSQPNMQEGLSSSAQQRRHRHSLSGHDVNNSVTTGTDSLHVQMPAPTAVPSANPSVLQQGVSNLARSASTQAKALFRWSRQPAAGSTVLPVSASGDTQSAAALPSVPPRSSSQTSEAAKQQHSTEWIQLAMAGNQVTQGATDPTVSLQPPADAFDRRSAWDDGWWEAQQTQAQLEGQEAASTSPKS